tara:strand:- start:182 stop:361 length:180 start_codon:yes stop_codon:yes gene_type:complete
MVTTASEGIHIIGILLRHVSKDIAIKILDDMDDEIANTTDNESLKESIRMVRVYLRSEQ